MSCALAATLAWGVPAAAQPVEPMEGSGAEPPGRSSGGGWRVYPQERHLLLRVEATTAARLVDPYAQGSLGPVGAFVDGTLTLFHVGRFHLGPSLGLQLGFDASVSQLAIQPGFGAFARLSPRVAVHGRIGVPLLVTRGLCPDEASLEIPVGMGQLRGGGIAPNQGVVRVPGAGYCPTLAVGVELGAGAAFYLTSGLALTGEVTFDFYRGDTVGFPLVGGGLGVLMDLEVLP